MASLADAILNRLAGGAELIALCPAANHFQNNLPQGMNLSTQDALIFNYVVAESIQDMQGQGDLGLCSFQLDAIGSDLGKLDQIMTAARLRLQGYDGTNLGIRIWGIRTGTRIDGPRDPDADLYRVTRRFEVWHNESAPTP